MRLISALVMTVLTLALCGICIAVRARRKKNTTERMVCEPYFIAVLGMFGGLIMCAPAVVTAIEGRPDSYGFLAFPLLGWFLIVIYLNCVVWYDQTGFRCRNFFGVTRRCDYRDVEGIRSGKDVRVFFCGHSYLLDGDCDGLRLFLKTLKKGYQNAHQKPVPESPAYRRRFDPMNGNMDNPWFYFWTYLLLGVLWITLLAIVCYFFFHVPNAERLTYEDASFRSFEIRDDQLFLIPEGREEAFCLDLYSFYDALPAPEVFCSGAVYRVGTNGKTNDIKSLTGADGTAYVTPALWLSAYQHDQISAMPFLALFCLAGTSVSWFGILVGRHPERYSERLRGLFYKEDVLLNYGKKGSH